MVPAFDALAASGLAGRHSQSHEYQRTGKTTAEMQTAATFLEVGWDFIDETKNGIDDR